MSDHTDLPFKAEYAKSGRSSCKACKSTIEQDSLRLALMVQSPHFDGKMPNWFHYSCFWKRGRPKSEDEIHGFHSLRWEDQQKIKDKIQADSCDPNYNVTPGSVNEDFSAEYAKSSRSTCRGCEQKIEKNTVRIGKKDTESQKSKMFGPMEMWHHLDCFVEKREELGFAYSFNVEQMVGFDQLKNEDKETLIAKLGKGPAEAKKRKGEESKGAGGKKPKKEEEVKKEETKKEVKKEETKKEVKKEETKKEVKKEETKKEVKKQETKKEETKEEKELKDDPSDKDDDSDQDDHSDQD